jgi:hypothetical protein
MLGMVKTIIPKATSENVGRLLTNKKSQQIIIENLTPLGKFNMICRLLEDSNYQFSIEVNDQLVYRTQSLKSVNVYECIQLDKSLIINYQAQSTSENIVLWVIRKYLDLTNNLDLLIDKFETKVINYLVERNIQHDFKGLHKNSTTISKTRTVSLQKCNFFTPWNQYQILIDRDFDKFKMTLDEESMFRDIFKICAMCLNNSKFAIVDADLRTSRYVYYDDFEFFKGITYKINLPYQLADHQSARLSRLYLIISAIEIETNLLANNVFTISHAVLSIMVGLTTGFVLAPLIDQALSVLGIDENIQYANLLDELGHLKISNND